MSEQSWIPVTTGNPPEEGAYLIVCDEHEDGTCIIVSAGQYEGNGIWTPDYNRMLPQSVVTHWMPLPPPPEQ